MWHDRSVATTGRKVRIPELRWKGAQGRAARRYGTTASAVVNAALVLFLNGELDGLLPEALAAVAAERHSGQSSGALPSG
jgi:hypothetical protein